MSKRDDFSEVIALDKLAPGDRRVLMEANEAARAAIARRLQIPAVERLKGTFDVTRTAAGAHLTGEIDAALVRECVVSLEPIEETIAESFAITFDSSAAQDAATIDIEVDSPEPLEGDTLDLGEILVQQLSLAMDPYPRKPGARPAADTVADADRDSPFAILRGLAGKPGGGDGGAH